MIKNLNHTSDQGHIHGENAIALSTLVNGITFNGADGINGTTAHLTVGSSVPDSTAGAAYRPYDGLLDEVAIYDQALTSTDFLERVNVPEPSSLALLGLGGLLVASRRRR